MKKKSTSRSKKKGKSKKEKIIKTAIIGFKVYKAYKKIK